MPELSFLTNHAKALMFVAHRPDSRLRDIGDALGISDRAAYGLVVDLTTAGYLVKERDGTDARRNRYRIQVDLPVPGAIGRTLTIGEVLDLFVATEGRSSEPT